jgi:transcriptional regulator with XRE-family HTH domain
MSFGQKLREIRRAKGLTQQGLADKAGIPQTTISGWENAGYLPNLIDGYKVAVALGISISDLLEDDQQTTGTDG